MMLFDICFDTRHAYAAIDISLAADMMLLRYFAAITLYATPLPFFAMMFIDADAYYAADAIAAISAMLLRHSHASPLTDAYCC